MNSTPAASKARRTAKSFAFVNDVLPSFNSARRMVAMLKATDCPREDRPDRVKRLAEKLGRKDHHDCAALTR